MAKKITSFIEAVGFLDSFVRPIDYERFQQKKQVITPLERMKYFLFLLDNPHRNFPSVVVSGTSGKGSTSTMISNMLIKAGYKTGLTVSPHLESIVERFQINNRQISQAEFIELLNKIMPAIEKLQKSRFGSPSYFEIVLAMVFLYFARAKVDIAVAEVGLEGKFDGTNVLDPLVFVLTNISLDHTDILGETIEEIAIEATDRIRKLKTITQSSKPLVVTGVIQPSVINIVQRKCSIAGVKLLQLHKDFDYEIKKEEIGKIVFDFFSSDNKRHYDVLKDMHLSLTGSFQAENAAISIAAVLQLEKSGFTVSRENIRQALKEIKIPGRFETFMIPAQRKQIQLILDGAHNPAKMNAFLKSLERLYPSNPPSLKLRRVKKIFITAFSKGHQTEKMLSQIAKIADVIVVTRYETATDMGFNRNEEVSKIKSKILNISDRKTREIFIAQNPKEALQKAVDIGKKERFSILVATGSLYLAGSLRKLLRAVRL